MKKEIGWLSVAWIVGLVLVTIEDALREASILNRNKMFFMMWLVPIIIGIVYYLIERKYAKRDDTRKAFIGKRLIIFAFWCAINFVGIILVEKMIDLDIWFVRQATGGWENFLNGIEYALYFIFNACAAIEALIIAGILYLIKTYVVKKDKKGDKDE